MLIVNCFTNANSPGSAEPADEVVPGKPEHQGVELPGRFSSKNVTKRSQCQGREIVKNLFAAKSFKQICGRELVAGLAA